ncbi:hypothetical protein [Sulfurovum sp.]|uniref:hypothetical protein n=1 Tax=Sulfurovum sp. TaxID=1969726 RepID=UPI002601FBA3|nr:hypothetical protein [Sulfurovum sp.]
MEKYPATYREFEVNGTKSKMYRMTLGMQSKIEDENISVLRTDVLEDCTDLDTAAISELRADQFDALYEDIMKFNIDPDAAEVTGETKKQ